MEAKARKSAAKPVVFTANRLRDGQVVWLDSQALWSESVSQAQIYDPDSVEQGRDLAQASEKRQEVVAPYVVEVDVTEQGPAPFSVREQIRAKGGPTTLYGAVEQRRGASSRLAGAGAAHSE